MKKSLFVVLSCAFLITQGVSYQFDVNSKWGKLQQSCIKSVMKSCRAIWEGCQVKRIGNACEAQYSLGIAFITNAMLGGEKEAIEIGVTQAKEAYKIGCKDLKHKNTCEIDKYFINKLLPPEVRSEVKQIIHGQ